MSANIDAVLARLDEMNNGEINYEVYRELHDLVSAIEDDVQAPIELFPGTLEALDALSIRARTTSPDAATEELLKRVEEAEAQSAEDRVEWQQMKERASQRFNAYQQKKRELRQMEIRAEKAEAERDAALAAIERVRVEADAYAEQPDVMEPCGAVAQALRTALDGAPEPETPELFPGTNAALDRLTVRKAAPAEAFCIEHGNFHAVELGDPTCEFEDGLGEPVDGEKP